jgi:adenylate cyclase
MTASIPQPREIEELLLGGELRYTRQDAIRLAKVSEEFTARLWQAFGFPQHPDDTVAFTEGDVDALRRIRERLDSGFLDEDTVIRMVRAVGQTMARLAEWQIDILMGAYSDPLEPPGPEAVQLVVGAAATHLRDIEPLLIHAWRRQLAASGTRALSVATNEDSAPGRVPVAIGFADMVAFTQLSRESDEKDLADVVERFEETAADLVAAHGGRLVKTLGDEVLFSAESARLGAEIGLRIRDTIKEDDLVPDVRVGMAYGPILPLRGDVFGTTVNTASRFTSIARPGTILIDAGLAAELENDEEYELQRLVRRRVRGLGTVHPYVLRRRAGA